VEALRDLPGKVILISVKGPRGRFSLARRAEKIKLSEVVKAIHGEDLFKNWGRGFTD
jgi:DNA-binding IscR family transcriptional regulator